MSVYKEREEMRCGIALMYNMALKGELIYSISDL